MLPPHLEIKQKVIKIDIDKNKELADASHQGLPLWI
jgi:hypothetical protein